MKLLEGESIGKQGIVENELGRRVPRPGEFRIERAMETDPDPSRQFKKK